jgi:hypothetical protein
MPTTLNPKKAANVTAADLHQIKVPSEQAGVGKKSGRKRESLTNLANQTNTYCNDEIQNEI